jgi:hypothetical protein
VLLLPRWRYGVRHFLGAMRLVNIHVRLSRRKPMTSISTLSPREARRVMLEEGLKAEGACVLPRSGVRGACL